MTLEKFSQAAHRKLADELARRDEVYYRCNICGTRDPGQYARCDHPGCPDGHDHPTGPVGYVNLDHEHLRALETRVDKLEHQRRPVATVLYFTAAYVLGAAIVAAAQAIGSLLP